MCQTKMVDTHILLRFNALRDRLAEDTLKTLGFRPIFFAPRACFTQVPRLSADTKTQALNQIFFGEAELRDLPPIPLHHAHEPTRHA